MVPKTSVMFLVAMMLKVLMMPKMMWCLRRLYSYGARRFKLLSLRFDNTKAEIHIDKTSLLLWVSH